MVHKSFIRRQLTSAKKQSSIFILCVALSMVTLVALRGFSESINQTLNQDAQAIHAGDIIIRSSYDFSPPVKDAIAQLKAQNQVESARIYEFYSIVRTQAEDHSLLAQLKVVETTYPFYGHVILASGRDFQTTLRSGQVIAEQLLIDRLGLRVGDQLRVGDITVTIADVVVQEPDRPVNFFTFGPRLFLALDDLDALGLVTEKSRVQHVQRLKVNDQRDLDQIAANIQTVANEDLEQVDTYLTAESGVRRFFDDFVFFLSLIAIFTLLLSGIGIQSALTAYLREQDQTVAIIKAVGATSRFITVHYLGIVAILGALGTSIGLLLGFLLQRIFPYVFQTLLPPNITLAISGQIIVESLLLGIFIVGSFTFLPLYRLEEFKPSLILRKAVVPLKKGWPYYLIIGLICLFFVALVLWQIQDIQIGLYFVGGVFALVLITAALTELVLYLLKHLPISSLIIRQALRGLFRPRNATRPIIITLAASLAVIFTIFLLEQNLDASFVQSYPTDSPNVFFLDIQPDQADAFAEALNIETTYYPVVRGGITAIHGQPLDRQREENRDRGGDNLTRQFNLTYRNALLESETLIEGDALFRPDWDVAQVSILADLRQLRDFQIGDTITFRIQGVPITVRVASVRQRREDTIEPFFNFVFTPDVLKNSPQTIFTALYVEKKDLATLQNKMVAQFPNISVIDITAAIASFGELARKIARIIRFFTGFSIAAGVLIIISSVFATRFTRIQESVYFKILGAKRRFVLQVFTVENLLLGAISAALALFMSQLGSWILIVQVFEIDYHPFLSASLMMLFLTSLLVIGVGLLASLSILNKRPITFLRELS